MKRPTHATVVAYLALVVALGGTGYAATGGTFLLGRSNSATTTTGLTNSAGTALSLVSKSGYAPLAVNQTTKVPRLNADLLDGRDASTFQLRINGTCPMGSAVAAVTASGGVTCHTDAITSTRGLLSTMTTMSCPNGDLVLSGGFSFTPDGFFTDRSGREGYRELPIRPIELVVPRVGLQWTRVW